MDDPELESCALHHFDLTKNMVFYGDVKMEISGNEWI